jgi:hypothetical protein
MTLRAGGGNRTHDLTITNGRRAVVSDRLRSPFVPLLQVETVEATDGVPRCAAPGHDETVLLGWMLGVSTPSGRRCRTAFSVGATLRWRGCPHSV